jgi:hypothetical protein
MSEQNQPIDTDAPMSGIVRTVVDIADDPAIEGDGGHLIAVRWDDGTISEDVWPLDRPVPNVGDRVERHE